MLKVRSSWPRGILLPVRPAFLLLASLLFPSVADAEAVDFQADPIVRGEPVDAAGVRGTVAIALVPDDYDPEALPLDLGRICTGVLIATTVVLTAAHCLEVCWDDCHNPDAPDPCYVCEDELRPPSQLRVLAGLRDLDDFWRPDRVEVARVETRIVPEAYLHTDLWWTYGRSDARHDIALLILEAPIRSLDPVPLLLDSDNLDGVEAVATGYGLRAPEEDLELLPEDHYRALLHETAVVIEGTIGLQIVTAANDTGNGICFGDSGGPLYVEREDTTYVAGVLSQFRSDASEQPCGRGAVYTSAPDYADWIYDKAPKAIPFSFGGGGGCSAQRSGSSQPALWFTGLLLLLLAMRRRSRTWGPGAIGICFALTIGCGLSGDGSFCTEQYDPGGFFCDPGIERIDLRAAEALARADAPDDALLFEVRSSPVGLLDPDGRAESWSFTYYWPGSAEPPDAMLLQTLVTSTRTYPADSRFARGALDCIPSEAVPALDSRRLLHDAIRFLESEGQTVTLLDGGNLFVNMSHVCLAADIRERSYVRYRGQAAVFDEEGTFIALVELSR